MKMCSCNFIIIIIFNSLLFAEDKVILWDSEDTLQKVIYSLNKIYNELTHNIFPNDTKTFTFISLDHLKAKLVIEGKNLKEVSKFNSSLGRRSCV